MLNRFSRRSNVTAEDIERALDFGKVTTLPNHYQLSLDSIDTAKPLLDLDKDAPVLQGLFDLQADLIGTTRTAKSAAAGSATREEVIMLNTVKKPHGSGRPAGWALRALNPMEREWKQRDLRSAAEGAGSRAPTTLESDVARAQIREITGPAVRRRVGTRCRCNSGSSSIRRIEDEVLGHGPLEPLLARPGGRRHPGERPAPGVRRAARQARAHRTCVFNDDAHLINIIDRIVSAVGRRIDESSPMVDARLKDGSRVNAIIPPLAIDGPLLSIRRFAVELLSADGSGAPRCDGRERREGAAGCSPRHA